ncbi:hypothetical protein ABPG75_003460 [Micractinium tetrahymenae]
MVSPRAACRIHLKDEVPPERDPRAVIAAFRETVNMTPDEVERWLATEQSRQAVEQVDEDADKQGRHAARRIVEMLHKDQELVWDGDLMHMWQITQYVRCHRDLLRQQVQQGMDPEQLRTSMERFHLMNFGFDPLKELQGGAGGSGAAGAPTGSGDKVEQAALPGQEDLGIPGPGPAGGVEWQRP